MPGGGPACPVKLRLSPFYRPVGSLRNTETCAATHPVRAVSVGTFPTELHFGGYEGPISQTPNLCLELWAGGRACPGMKTRNPYYYADVAGRIIILLSLVGFALIIILAMR